jgi:type I restriction enzyme S subunit
MAAFPAAKLGDCVDLLAGFAFKSERFTDNADDIALVKGENVSQGHILWDISKRWPVAEWSAFEKYHLRTGDVVVAMDRPWVPAGLKWAYIRGGAPRALLVQRCSRLRSNTPKLDQGFLRFVIGGPGFESYVKPITTGVNVPHISGRQILDYEFLLPPLPIQRRIASVLSAYDDLIENCQRRIKILESMARALYREWFVHFRFPGHENHPRVASPLGEIPEGWEVKKLFELTKVNYGKNLPTKKLADDGLYPVYGAAKIIGRYTEYTREQRTIICGCRGSVGEMQITQPQCYVTNNSFTFDPTHPDNYFWLFHTLRERGLRDVVGGAAQPQITLEGISSVELVTPPLSFRNSFQQAVSALFEKMWTLDSQIQNLRRTRDLLLPRLLSGQIALDELETA